MKKTSSTTKARDSRRAAPRGSTILISERALLCLWAAVILREPEPLTRLLKKILKPAVMAKGKKWLSSTLALSGQ